jgi:predicted phosphoribosyltransferase
VRHRADATRYRDRRHAGQVLGWRLVEAGVLERFPEPRLVLGLPRGGVPVAGEVARILAAPLDVFLVRKLGVPGHEELAMGAIASGGTRVLNGPVIDRLGVAAEDVEAVAESETAVLRRRERAYRDDRAPAAVAGVTVVVVDDGLATGASMRAALHALGAQKPAAVVVAVPVGSPETCRMLRAEADEVVCVRMPDRFLAVGQAYDDFSPTTDDEVRAVLEALNPVSVKSPHRP